MSSSPIERWGFDTVAHTEQIKTGRFYCIQSQTIAIVAVITEFDGQLFDWAAYIASVPPQPARAVSERETSVFAARHGAKLAKQDAVHYFPDLPAGKWRP